MHIVDNYLLQILLHLSSIDLGQMAINRLIM